MDLKSRIEARAREALRRLLRGEGGPTDWHAVSLCHDCWVEYIESLGGSSRREVAQ